MRPFGFKGLDLLLAALVTVTVVCRAYMKDLHCWSGVLKQIMPRSCSDSRGTI